MNWYCGLVTVHNVERALELKMIYQPLNKQQEEKYRRFCQKRERCC